MEKNCYFVQNSTLNAAFSTLAAQICSVDILKSRPDFCGDFNANIWILTLWKETLTLTH
jgi:hypothetical protein